MYVKRKQRKAKSRNINIVVDNQSKKYHTEECTKLRESDPKYIIEITTKEHIIKNKGYSKCEKCFFS